MKPPSYWPPPTGPLRTELDLRTWALSCELVETAVVLTDRPGSVVLVLTPKRDGLAERIYLESVPLNGLPLPVTASLRVVALRRGLRGWLQLQWLRFRCWWAQ